LHDIDGTMELFYLSNLDSSEAFVRGAFVPATLFSCSLFNRVRFA